MRFFDRYGLMFVGLVFEVADDLFLSSNILCSDTIRGNKIII